MSDSYLANQAAHRPATGLFSNTLLTNLRNCVKMLLNNQLEAQQMPLRAGWINDIPDIHKSIVVAHQILWERRDESVDTTPMQVLKLTYICYGVILALSDERLFDESIEAWKFGPVIPSVYQSFKSFGNRPIQVTVADQHELSEQHKNLIRQIELIHRRYDGIQLSSLTHTRGTPWDTTIRRDGVGAKILDDDIRSYYQGHLKEDVVLQGR